MATKLTPPDPKRCQAEKPNGTTFMTLGGAIGRRERCGSPPTVVARENKKGRDGQRGSMSLCDDCAVVFVNQMGSTYATLKPIKRAGKKRTPK